jgi:hypothetical protein
MRVYNRSILSSFASIEEVFSGGQKADCAACVVEFKPCTHLFPIQVESAVPELGSVSWQMARWDERMKQMDDVLRRKWHPSSCSLPQLNRHPYASIWSFGTECGRFQRALYCAVIKIAHVSDGFRIAKYAPIREFTFTVHFWELNCRTLYVLCTECSHTFLAVQVAWHRLYISLQRSAYWDAISCQTHLKISNRLLNPCWQQLDMQMFIIIFSLLM